MRRAAALRRSGSSWRTSSRTGSSWPTVGDVFISVFTTFGSFSIVAGVLLIFLIFVMLSAERRSELGIARAIGTRREHVVQMFVFEGLAYDLGAGLGRGRARRRRGVRDGVGDGRGVRSARAWRSSAVTLRSLVVAYALGVLLTLVVVALSAWRVSRLNIVAAVRGLPEPLARRGSAAARRARRGHVLLGALAWSGSERRRRRRSRSGSRWRSSAWPLARADGVLERLAYTAVRPLLLVWWLLPFDTVSGIAGASAWWPAGLRYRWGAEFAAAREHPARRGAGRRLAGGSSRRSLRRLHPPLPLARRC